MKNTRIERDGLGEREIPADSLTGIHTARAMENFALAGRPVHAALVRAYGEVKLACAVTNRSLGAWQGDEAKADAIEQACREVAAGQLSAQFQVDALQGGAGTSTNMALNEVIANRALQLLRIEPGRYEVISPLDDVNLHQSTNDTFPTAMRLAAIRQLKVLEAQVLALQEVFQSKEQAFAHVVKVGRTEFQDAVLVTLGREMGAYAEAFNRDRWRLYKCEERLRVVNLGGTAVGTGIGAPREFIFRAADALRDQTGIGFARSENLMDGTQNADVFVEVSGNLKALAVSLVKVSSDLRLMSSGPEAGLGEIRLPARQAGSSIMPGKVNPVIPEAVTQAALLAMGHDQVIASAAAMGSLELNPFLPLIAHCLLDACDLLARACQILNVQCVEGLEANEARCKVHVGASTATATALISTLGYERSAALTLRAKALNASLRETAISEGLLTAAEFDALTSPEAVTRLGSPIVSGGEGR